MVIYYIFQLHYATYGLSHNFHIITVYRIREVTDIIFIESINLIHLTLYVILYKIRAQRQKKYFIPLLPLYICGTFVDMTYSGKTFDEEV